MSELKTQEADQKQTSHVFEFSYWPVLVDYAARWLVFELWRLDLIPGWLFWSCQIIIIPFSIFSWVITKEQRLKEKYGITDQPNVDASLWAALFCWFVALSGSYVAYSLYQDWSFWAKSVSAVLTFVFYGFYIGLLYVTPIHTLSKADRLKKIESLEQALSDDEVEIVDANDVRIVRMETEISSISQRIDSYILESALFGALAFSGFLTLIASERPILTNLQSLINGLRATANEAMQSGFSGLDASLMSYVTNDNLLAAVALETLISSMFFVSVVVSRLRFYSYLRRVDYAVRIARMYNNKEEEVFQMKLQFPASEVSFDARLDSLTRKVADAIDHAEPLFRDLAFVSRYMWGFRNLGIGSFILILITSGFLVSRTLGLLFVSVSILASLYSFIDKWWREKKLQNIPFFLALERKIFRISRAVKR